MTASHLSSLTLRLPADNPAPTYRGYRKQATYVLERVFRDGPDSVRIFQPEGIEDLAIWSGTELHEVVQVKDLSADLAVSHLYNSFARFLEKRKRFPSVKLTLATFGPVGEELAKAVLGDGKERAKVATKLVHQLKERFQIDSTEVEIAKVLKDTSIENADDSQLTRSVLLSLEKTNCGADPQRSFENLWAKIFQASEASTRVTNALVRDWIASIGRFVLSRAAFYDEWQATITPLENRELNSIEVERLRSRFAEGESGSFEHILADLDVPRFTLTQSVHDAWAQRDVVILRGASGQGKSTLAYRVCYDAAPSDWRFVIDSRRIRSSAHAARVAFVLSEFGLALRLKPFVIVEVAPGDSTWTVLVDELSKLHVGKVIVSIREQDWNRTRPQTVCGEVVLELDEEEARRVYKTLTEIGEVSVPTFAEAWASFGGKGPLLEFMFVVRTNQTLEMRLREQIKNLRNRNSDNYLGDDGLQFLRCLMAVTMTGATCDANVLAKQCGLMDPAGTVEILENEFLISQHDDGSIGGLHSVRSTLAAKLLHDRTFSKIEATVQQCVPCVVERDLRNYLTHCFCRFAAASDSIYGALLDFVPKSWMGYAGVQSAILWRCVDSWLNRNRDVVDQLYDLLHEGWFLALDWDIAKELASSPTELIDRIEIDDATRRKLQDLRETAEGTANLFAPLMSWWQSHDEVPPKPTNEYEWECLASTAFWMGRLKYPIAIENLVDKTSFHDACNGLGIAVMASVCRGLESLSRETAIQWINEKRESLVDRFRDAARVLVFDDDGVTIDCHGIITLELRENMLRNAQANATPNVSLNEIAWERSATLRNLFPDRENFRFDGYGHDVSWLGITLNPAVKSPSRDGVKSTWGPSLNHVFTERGTWPHRPELWKDHFDHLAAVQYGIEGMFRELRRVIQQRRGYDPKCLKRIANAASKKCRSLITAGCPLPKVAIDELGQTSAGENKSTGGWTDRYQEACRDYLRAIGNFANQVHEVVRASIKFTSASDQTGKAAAMEDLNKWSQLSQSNLADAERSLNKLVEVIDQSDMARRLRMRHPSLANNETSQIVDALNLWREACDFLRSRKWPVGARSKSKGKTQKKAQGTNLRTDPAEQLRANWISRLQVGLDKASNEAIHFRLVSSTIHFDGLPALWICADIKQVEAAMSDQWIKLSAEIINECLAVVPSSFECMVQKRLWHRVLVFRTFRGHWVADQVIETLDSARYLDLEINWQTELWRFVPSEIVDLEKKFELPIASSPWTTLCRRIQQHFSEATGVALHLADLTRVPCALDEKGTAILTGYLEEKSYKLSESVTDATTELLSLAVGLSPHKAETGRPYVVAAINDVILASEILKSWQSGDHIIDVLVDNLPSFANDLMSCAVTVESSYFNLLADQISGTN